VNDTRPTEPRRNDTGALLQLALAGVVLILLGIAASQARREPEDDSTLPMMEDTTGYDFDDALPPDDTVPLDSMPIDTPFKPDTIPTAPSFTPGATP
jgi:hypothetical protein